MSFTRAQMRAEVAFRIADSNTAYTDRINYRLQWAINQISQDPRLRFHDRIVVSSPSLSAGFNTVSLVSLVRPLDIMGIRNADRDRAWVRLTFNQYQNLPSSDTGEPTHYYHLNNGTAGLRVYPTVSATYAGDTIEITYRSLPPPMSADTSTSGILANQTADNLADRLDELIILGAAYRMLRDLNETERAQAALLEYRALRSQMLDLYKEEFNMSGGTISVVK